jgi:hypothetical protein
MQAAKECLALILFAEFILGAFLIVAVVVYDTLLGKKKDWKPGKEKP